jgi:hypothetical protein
VDPHAAAKHSGEPARQLSSNLLCCLLSILHLCSTSTHVHGEEQSIFAFDGQCSLREESMNAIQRAQEVNVMQSEITLTKGRTRDEQDVGWLF